MNKLYKTPMQARHEAKESSMNVVNEAHSLIINEKIDNIVKTHLKFKDIYHDA